MQRSDSSESYKAEKDYLEKLVPDKRLYLQMLKNKKKERQYNISRQ